MAGIAWPSGQVRGTEGGEVLQLHVNPDATVAFTNRVERGEGLMLQWRSELTC